MADVSKTIEGILSGLASGGLTAFGTFWPVVRDFRKRLALLEERVGTSDPKTGLYLTISLAEESLKKIRRDIDAWEDDPPSWAKRLFARSRAASTTDLTGQIAFEDQIGRVLKELRERTNRLEDEIIELHKARRDDDNIVTRDEYVRDSQMRAEEMLKVVPRDEYVRDSQMRAEEMLKVREHLATANGLLRGVLSALGFTDK
jgi:hypothetical protein